MYLQKVISRKTFFQKISFLLASWRSMTKKAKSGSKGQQHGSAVRTDPYQNVMNPQHCLVSRLLFRWRECGVRTTCTCGRWRPTCPPPASTSRLTRKQTKSRWWQLLYLHCSWRIWFVLPFRSALIRMLRIRDFYPGSRILIFTHPGSRISDHVSRITYPKTATKERGEKN